MVKKYISFLLSAACLILILAAASCNKGESYADLLKDETQAVNWFLSGENVRTEVPADSIFEVGEDAPFYRMDEDGSVYMQVLATGDMNDRPQKNDRVYFRYSRMNLKNFYELGLETWIGNASDLDSGMGATSFIYDNYRLSSTYQYGTGIQLPLKYFGYNSRVRLVLKAQSGFTSDQSSCLPYLVDVRYFKGVY